MVKEIKNKSLVKKIKEVIEMKKKTFLLIPMLIFLSMLLLKEAAAYPQLLGNKVVCPVSGETFNIESDSKKVSYEGKVYYFCCSDCVALFNANQKKYLQAVEEKKGKVQQDVFSCKHCGLRMSVSDPNQKCNVCKCNKIASECKRK